MKPGTIVVCLPFKPDEYLSAYIEWMPRMDEKTPYMVREFLGAEEMKDGQPSVYFEEGIIGHWTNRSELAFPVRYLREILPSEEISNEIKEALNAPIEELVLV